MIAARLSERGQTGLGVTPLLSVNLSSSSPQLGRQREGTPRRDDGNKSDGTVLIQLVTCLLGIETCAKVWPEQISSGEVAVLRASLRTDKNCKFLDGIACFDLDFASGDKNIL